jgi:hypothetical protein
LGRAAAKNHSAVVDLLLERGARTDLIINANLRASLEARKKTLQSTLTLFSWSFTYHADTQKKPTPTAIHTSQSALSSSNSLSSTQKQEDITPAPKQAPLKADIVVKHNAEYATRVMNITALDMKLLPPIFAWLYTTPLSSFDDCIADLKELQMQGKKVLTNLPMFVSSVKAIVSQMAEDSKDLKLSIDERAAIYLYTMEFPELPDLKINGSIYYLMNMYLRSQDRV